MSQLAGTAVYNPPDPSNFRLGTAGGRLALEDATTLSYRRYNADVVEVGGQYVNIDATDGLQRTTADNTITATGASAAAPSASTNYFVYVSNGSATTFPSSIRLSTQAPTAVNGVRYLGDTGNALNWRFIGWVRLNASSEFSDDTSARHVINAYNRLPQSLVASPAYNNNNAATTYSLNSATFARMNGGTGDSVSYLGDGEAAASFHLDVSVSLAGAAVNVFGIGFNSDTQPSATCGVPAAAANASCSCSYVVGQVAQGSLVTISMLGMTGGLATTIFADRARTGAAGDPAATQLFGFVLT